MKEITSGVNTTHLVTMPMNDSIHSGISSIYRVSITGPSLWARNDAFTLKYLASVKGCLDDEACAVDDECTCVVDFDSMDAAEACRTNLIEAFRLGKLAMDEEAQR